MKKLAHTTKFLSVGGLIMVMSVGHAEVLVQVMDHQDQPLKDAVVYLEGEALKPKVEPAMTEIIQKGKRFNPLVTVVQTGTRVNFPNQDNVRHHVYSFSPIKKFELKLYSGVPANPVLFDKAGTAVLGCNIHDSMLAYVHVVDTPHFAKTDANGMARLPSLQEAGLQLKVWHYAQLDAQTIHSQAWKIEQGKPIRVMLNIQAEALVN